MAPVPLRMGGVPEHFMVPLESAVRDGDLAREGFDAHWHTCHGGTAEMLSMLSKGELDIAFPLTESAIAGIATAAHPSIRIAGSYVASPLNWAISVLPSSPFSSPDDLAGSRCAISRYGSGSHVMAVVLEREVRERARARGVDVQPFSFVVGGTGEGMKDAIVQGRADFFMWEYFTSKPWYDSGVLRHLATHPTPWPAFCCATTTASLARLGAPALRRVLSLASARTAAFHSDHAQAERAILARFPHYKPEDARAWLAGVRFEPDCARVSAAVVRSTVATLGEAGVLKGDQAKVGVEQLVAGEVAEVVE